MKNNISLTEFLGAFFPDSAETICFRSFKPKNAPDNQQNKPLAFSVTRKQLLDSTALQARLKSINKESGLYFVVNAGGNQDREISRFNAFFIENDNLSIPEQHKRLDESLLAPSIRIETKKSVHAYWLIDGDCKETEWRDMQHRLIAKFDGDKAIQNPSRVMRLPFFNHVSIDSGRVSYKRVKIIEFAPDRRYTLAEMQLDFPQSLSSCAGDLHLIGSYSTNNSKDKNPTICEGERNDFLTSLAGTMRRRGMTENALFEALKAENIARCQPPLDNHEVHGIARSIMRYPPGENKTNIKSPIKGDEINLPSLRTVNLAEVKAKKVEYFWKPFIPRGTFILIDGEEGIGKSLLALAVGSAVASGKMIDTTEGFSFVDGEPGNILLLSAEESLSHVVKPRLLAMGAPVERFVAIDEPFSFDREGIKRLENTIAEHNPMLVIIDPLFSYTGKISLNDDNEIRSVTNELIRIAEKFGCTISGIRHIGKAKGNGEARAAGLNGVGWRASSRSALLVGKDPNMGELAICQHKNNLGPKSEKSYGF
ncbi:MAG TPA: AAA family ATPase, partial [Segetibacter sp.]